MTLQQTEHESDALDRSATTPHKCFILLLWFYHGGTKNVHALHVHAPALCEVGVSLSESFTFLCDLHVLYTVL